MLLLCRQLASRDPLNVTDMQALGELFKLSQPQLPNL